MIDVYIGKKVFIGDSFSSLILLNICDLIHDKQTRSDFIIALQLDLYHQVKIVNKKYRKHNKVLKLMNLSNEHGINQRAQDMIQHGFLLLYYLLDKLLDPKIIDQINDQIIYKRRVQVTVNELISVFYLLNIMLLISFLIFIFEIIYFFIICYLKYSY